MRYWVYISLMAVSGMFFSCETESEGNTAAAPKPVMEVEAYKIEGQPFENNIKATANLLANEAVELKAPIAGTVLGIYYKEGEDVKKGEMIIRLDDRNWKAQVTGLKAELESAEKELDRKKALLEIEGSSQEEIDQASAQVENLKAQIQGLYVNIQLANVRAPFSGQIGMRDFSLGAYLREGDVITSLTELKNLKVDFDLPEEYRTSIKKGNEVHVLLNKDTLSAKIYAIGSSISSESRTVNVRARLQQPKGAETIMPGSFAEVLVSTNHLEDALLVPTQAVVPEINNQTVYVYKNGKVKRNTIKLGTRTAEKVHVLEGIEKGDTIITTGLMQIREGMDVNLKSVQ